MILGTTIPVTPRWWNPRWWKPKGWDRSVAVGIVISAIAALLLLVYATGGTKWVFPHLLYLPILASAFYFGIKGGLVAAVVSGLSVAPMPLDVEAGIPQPTIGWMVRLGAFMMVGFLAGWARELTFVYLADLNSRLRHENALAAAAGMLLGPPNPGAIEDMVVVLRETLDIDNVYYGENTDDPELGLCWSLRWESVRPGLTADLESWRQVPYSQMPAAYAELSQGRTALRQVESLSGAEQSLFQDRGVRSALSIPVQVGGEWHGSIGFAYLQSPGDWSQHDIELLKTIAQMVGVFLERVRSRNRLEDLIRSRDEFVASVSHALRTPLSAVLGFASELRTGWDQLSDEARDEFLGLILDSSGDLASTIENLLVAARGAIETLAMRRERIDLGEVIDAAVKSCHFEGQAPAVLIDSDAEGVLGDRPRLEQVLRNLLENSMEHGGENISISSHRSNGQRVSIEIADDGQGIPADEWQAIFEPYHRLRSEPGRPQPLGLGLSVSRTLVRMMGGDLSYRRTDNQSILEFALDAVD